MTNNEHPENIFSIYTALVIFHLDISDIYDNDEHSEKIFAIFVILFVFHLDISGNMIMMSIHETM